MGAIEGLQPPDFEKAGGEPPKMNQYMLKIQPLPPNRAVNRTTHFHRLCCVYSILSNTAWDEFIAKIFRIAKTLLSTNQEDVHKVYCKYNYNL